MKKTLPAVAIEMGQIGARTACSGKRALDQGEVRGRNNENCD
ncbi:hypothetical protein RSK20926_13364 [Roseobacter sp. SK209-2-6]|nr:hypothetical protein RSK20926_13364 [Roseobacter sp. SK209-2-6]